MVRGVFSSRETEDRETTHYTDKINNEPNRKERIYKGFCLDFWIYFSFKILIAAKEMEKEEEI